MKGLPAFIQTPQDLKNLYDLALENKVPKDGLADKIYVLLARQYHRVPILARSGKSVTTRYFPEVQVGDTIAGGMKITKIEHVEALPEESGEASMDSGTTSYEKTVLTLSSALADDSQVLPVFRPDNILTQNGFDASEINSMLEVLHNA